MTLNNIYLQSSHKLNIFFYLVILVALIGCAPVTEQVLYPDKISPLSDPAPADLTDNTITASINAPSDDVWRSLILVLRQYAFITHIKKDQKNPWTLSYVDRTTLFMKSKQREMELPFQVVVESMGDDTTSITVFCRWDLITSKDYIKSRKKSYEDLKNGMLSEAYILVNRVNVQSTISDRWKWLNTEKPL